MNCTAEVLYPPVGQGTAPEVNFTFEGDIGKNPDEEDNTFYQRLKSMKEPLEAQNIPGIPEYTCRVENHFFKTVLRLILLMLRIIRC